MLAPDLSDAVGGFLAAARSYFSRPRSHLLHSGVLFRRGMRPCLRPLLSVTAASAPVRLRSGHRLRSLRLPVWTFLGRPQLSLRWPPSHPPGRVSLSHVSGFQAWAAITFHSEFEIRGSDGGRRAGTPFPSCSTHPPAWLNFVVGRRLDGHRRNSFDWRNEPLSSRSGTAPQPADIRLPISPFELRALPLEPLTSNLELPASSFPFPLGLPSRAPRTQMRKPTQESMFAADCNSHFSPDLAKPLAGPSETLQP